METKNWTSSSKFVFRNDRTNNMAALASDWLRQFWLSETAERISQKLDVKQELDVLYQFCVFHAARKNKTAARPIIDWDNFE